MKPASLHNLSQEGVDPRRLADREAEVLGRLMARVPPTDVVVSLYGRGELHLEMRGRSHAVPWLALALVDGDSDGPSLSDRIQRTPGGCDPVRAHRLIRRLAEGFAILHDEKVIHRRSQARQRARGRPGRRRDAEDRRLRDLALRGRLVHEEFTDKLLPLLEVIEKRWRVRAAREGQASTRFRSTQRIQEPETIEPLAESIEIPPLAAGSRPIPPLLPRNLVFQSDGRALARFGGRQFYLSEDGHLPMPIPVNDPAVAATTHVVRNPFGGFALVGLAHLRIVRPGRVGSVRLPARGDGRPVGEIQAAVGDPHALGVVTGDVGEGGPELWLLGGDERWTEPLVLPGVERVHAVASSPYGFLAVGEVVTAQGSRARAVFTSEEGQPSGYIKGLNDKTPLLVALSTLAPLPASSTRLAPRRG